VDRAPSGIVALALRGSTLYVGGRFFSAGGETRAHLAAFDAVSGALTPWDPDGGGGFVDCLAISGSLVYAGGDFNTQGHSRIAAIDAVSGVATGWDPGADGEVKCLAVSGSTIYAGGTFTHIGGQARNRIAALDASSGQATAWDPNASGGNQEVHALAVDGAIVYAGGNFTSIGGAARVMVAALEATTGLATSWDAQAAGAGGSDGVLSIAVSGSTVYLGGDIGSAGGVTQKYAIALGATTALATSWNSHVDGKVQALAVSGSMVYLAGEISSIASQTRNHFAALDATTGQLLPWGANLNFDDGVQCILVGGNTIYVGGGFNHAGGQTRYGLAAVDASSGDLIAWDPVGSDDILVRSMVLDGSTLFVGGQFSTIGGQLRNNLAAIHVPSGTVTSWAPNATATPQPQDIVLSMGLGTNTLYVGGLFTQLGGQSRNDLGAVDLATGAATSWDPDLDGLVYALVVDEPTVYAGGGFHHAGALTRETLAAFDVSSTVANFWNPNLAGSGINILAMARSGPMIYVGGNFGFLGTVENVRENVAAIDATSGAIDPWNPNLNSNVHALAVTANTVYVGGQFGGVQGYPQSCFSAISTLCTKDIEPPVGGNDAPITVAVVGSHFLPGASVKLSRSGAPDIAGSVVDVAPNGTTLTTRFALKGAEIGSWTVVVTNPDDRSAALPNGFTVEGIVAPELRVDLVGRDSIRTSYPTAFDLVVNNLGNVDAVDVPVWLTGIPLGAAVDLGFQLATPNRDPGEPDWNLDSLSFTSPQGRYLVMVIPRIPPGSIARRVNITIPNGVTAFRLQAAVTPPWVDGVTLRSCLNGAGVIQNPACMGTQLTAINAALASAPSVETLSGIGVWAKIGWQCEGATSLTGALDKSRQVLEYMRQAVDLGTASVDCSDVLLPRWRDALAVVAGSSVDPNDKLGPHRVPALAQDVFYSVSFENMDVAGAYPAHKVDVVDNIDASKVDPATIKLRSITIGKTTVLLSPQVNDTGDMFVSLRPTMGVKVRVRVDPLPFPQIKWDFVSWNLATNREAPTDSGFLLTNKYPPLGQGSVQFTVSPLATTATLMNTAAITFDGNTTATPTWMSTVDNTPPGSRVLQLSPNSGSPSIPVSWNAYDPQLGVDSPPPGDFKDFTIYVSRDGSPYSIWRQNTIATTDTLVPPGDHHPHTYAFYSEAHDTCSNVEEAPLGADATTQSLLSVGLPSGPQLMLEGAHPNPARGAIRAWFVLPSREPAALELIDIAGRHVLRRDVGPLGPGRHGVELGVSHPLRPGLYFLRLTQSGRELKSRVVLIR
jgi:hypothetical protein